MLFENTEKHRIKTSDIYREQNLRMRTKMRRKESATCIYFPKNCDSFIS